MKLVRVSDCCGVRLRSIEFDYVRLLDRSITKRSIAFDWPIFFCEFDYRTQANPIERLGSIGFDYKRSISYAGIYVSFFCQ